MFPRFLSVSTRPPYPCVLCAVVLAVAGVLPATAQDGGAIGHRTWIVESAAAVRPPPPPDNAATQIELDEVEQAHAALTDDERGEAIRWNAGAANHFWVEMLLHRYRVGPPSPFKGRGLSLLNVAIYDAVASAATAQRHYARSRPTVEGALFDPGTAYGYPSVRAAAAGAAASVLAYLLPDEADVFSETADVMAHSRVAAGVSYPSDTAAGLDLGRAVAQAILDEVAAVDRSDSEWHGERPTGPDKLKGERFVYPAAGDWKPWVIESPEAYLPEPPVAVGSDAMRAQLDELKAIKREVPDMILAWSQHGVESAYHVWYQRLAASIFENDLGGDLPHAAFIYATVATSNSDAIVACFHAKYTWWLIRPAQLDDSLKTLFPSPPHPSYPSAHSCAGSNFAATLAHFFPEREAEFVAMSDEAGRSRLIAGIHYPMDKVAGEVLGRHVADDVLQRLAEKLLIAAP